MPGSFSTLVTARVLMTAVTPMMAMPMFLWVVTGGNPAVCGPACVKAAGIAIAGAESHVYRIVGCEDLAGERRRASKDTKQCNSVRFGTLATLWRVLRIDVWDLLTLAGGTCDWRKCGLCTSRNMEMQHCGHPL